MLVIGVGNPDRGDDAAGWAVVEDLSDVARVVCTDGEPARLMELWDHASDVVVVDAITTGASTGTVQVFDLLTDELPTRAVASSHGMGPVEAVELGRLLEVLPTSLRLVGIEAASFEPGRGLTPEVARGVEEAAALIRSWLDAAVEV